MLLLVLLGSWWGVRRRDRAAEQEAEAEHLLAGAGELNALPRRWVTLFWSQRSSIAESRWAGMVESSLIIGSDAAQCDLCLPDRKVSRSIVCWPRRGTRCSCSRSLTGPRSTSTVSASTASTVCRQ